MPYFFTAQQQAKIDQLYRAAIDKGATAMAAYAETYQYIAVVLAGNQAAGATARSRFPWHRLPYMRK